MMTSADKTKLDGIAAGAQANTVTSVAGKTGAVTLTNSDVGLDNVTNHAQVRKLASSTTGNVPVWDGTTGDQLSNGYGVETVLNGSSSNLARADAIKSYVDEVAQGLKAVESAFVLLNTNISATYNADGHEPGWATLTSTTNGAFPSVDDVSSNDLNVVGVRILITGQTNAAHNGIYVLKTPGDGSTPWVLRRCQQCYQSSQLPGTFVFVKLGTTYANTGWVATVADVTTFVIGVDDIIYVQFSGAGTFTAGTGLTLTGTEFSVNSSLPHVTEVGTITAGTWNASTIAVNRGGTGQLSYTNGELLIGNSTGSTLTKATLTAGTNISITNGSGSITINAASTNIAEGTRTTTTVPITSSTGSNATLSAATTTLAGVMTSADKTKLDGIAAGAQVNVATNLTYSTATTTGTVNSSTGTNATIPAATTALAGLMSSADKTKLDGIAAGAQATSIVNGTSSVSVVSSGGDTVVTRAESTHSTFNNQGIVLSTGVFVGDLDGNAASANYADLAEKYTAIDGIVPGTVVTVCSHPDHELEACTETAFPVGVVSTQPAFLMNSNLENGVAIALKGRVPTRVVGAVNKGDLLFAGANGCAVKNGVYKVAVALESNNDEGEKLVECMLVV
jgi:nitrite reductase/ring-hydroxylating ferredoxin subunit